MPGKLISVVYVRASGIALRIIDTTMDADDSHVAVATVNLPSSLALTSIDASSLPLLNGRPDIRIETLITAISKAGGPTINLPQNCHVIDATGLVVDTYIGDPALLRANAVRTQQLVLAAGGKSVGQNAVTVQVNADAGIGWKYAGGIWTAPVLKAAQTVKGGGAI